MARFYGIIAKKREKIMKAAVLIADLKDSRKLGKEERIEAQIRLAEIVDYFINPVFEKELVAKLEFSAGDSVQGIFARAEDALSCCLMIKAMLYPFEIRCGIGTGEVIGLELSSLTNRLDGEAYHNASRALRLCKAENTGVLFVSGTPYDLLINQYFENAWLLEARQNRKRKVIANTIFLLDPVREPALFKQYKTTALKAFSGILRYYGGKAAKAGDVRLEEMLLGKGFRLDESSPTIGKKVVNGSLQEALAILLGVTGENMRQMIIKSGINNIKKCYICAAFLADRVLDEIKSER